MIKRCIFMLFCAPHLFTPTVDAYTAIAVASSSSDGGGEQCAYQFFNPKTPGQHGLFLSRDLSNSEIQQGAIKRCRRDGGIHPKIVLSTGKPGYFAIAVSHEQEHRVVGWSGPQSSGDAAANEAIAKCKERGGTDPHIKAQWHDYYHSFDKHV
jgi:Domain of unknown function (DUF4189)